MPYVLIITTTSAKNGSRCGEDKIAGKGDKPNAEQVNALIALVKKTYGLVDEATVLCQYMDGCAEGCVGIQTCPIGKLADSERISAAFIRAKESAR